MEQRRLGRSELMVTPIGFGAFKIGRNIGTKYPDAYSLPDDTETERLLNGVLDLGINYIDTAPAYGTSQERIGRFLSHRREELVLSTKVGERFEDGCSGYDYSRQAVTESIEQSLRQLQTDVLDLVFVHSNGDDLKILNQTDIVETLRSLKQSGVCRSIGFSGKTEPGAREALPWADALMLEYNLKNQSHKELMREAAANDVGIVVKKPLASGTLNPQEAIRHVLSSRHVQVTVVGTLNLNHLQENIRVVDER